MQTEPDQPAGRIFSRLRRSQCWSPSTPCWPGSPNSTAHTGCGSPTC